MAGTPSQTRPEPMNASPYHSKVKVTLRFADQQFPAGGMVSGKMEMECKAEKGLGIGVIMVELYAIEGEWLLWLMLSHMLPVSTACSSRFTRGQYPGTTGQCSHGMLYRPIRDQRY